MLDIAGIGIGAIAVAAGPSLASAAARCIGPGGEEYVRVEGKWERASEALTEKVMEHRLPAEKPLSDERLIALYKERVREVEEMEKTLRLRGYNPVGPNVWKKV